MSATYQPTFGSCYCSAATDTSSLPQQPSSLWQDRAFLLLNCCVLAWLLCEQRGRETKEQRRGKTYITFLRARGSQLLIKTLTFGPFGPLCMIHGLRRPLIPFICLWCVLVWCVHMWECTLRFALKCVCVQAQVEAVSLVQCYQSNKLAQCPSHKVYSS